MSDFRRVFLVIFNKFYFLFVPSFFVQTRKRQREPEKEGSICKIVEQKINI